MINFAFLYSENPSQVKNFFTMLENISDSLNLLNLNFLNQVDNNGNTLLHNAVLNKDLHLIQGLFNLIKLVKNLDSNTKSKVLDSQNKEGNTPFHIAARLCEQAAVESDDCKLCESIAKLLDREGCKKNIPNKQGEIISSSESPKINTSEYKSNIINLFGTKSINTSTKGGRQEEIRNIDNMATEVSVDYVQHVNALNKNKLNLNSMSTDVSIDNVQKGGAQNANDLTNSESYTSNSESTSIVTTTTTETTISSDSSSESISSNTNELTESNESAGQKGGNVKSENSGSGLSDTSTFVKTLLSQFNSMKGGSRNIKGARRLPSLSDYEINEMYGGRDFGLSRDQMKESSNIHDEVVKKFMDDGKSEEEARIMKMALYKYTKEKHPDLNNLDRAKKMKEYSDESSILKKLDLDNVRKIYADVKKAKSMASESSNISESANKMESITPTESTESNETSEPKPKKKTTAKKTTAKKAKK